MCKSVNNNCYLQGGVSTKMLVGGRLSRRSRQLPIRQEPRGDADPLLNTQGWMGLLSYLRATFGSIRLLVARLFRQIAGRFSSPETLETLGWFSVLFRCEFLYALFEDRSCREAHGTGVGVEVEEVLSVPFRPVLDLPYTLANTRIGGRVSWSIALVGGKQLMIHRALRQAGLLVCPLDEISEGLFSRVDPCIADDP